MVFFERKLFNDVCGLNGERFKPGVLSPRNWRHAANFGGGVAVKYLSFTTLILKMLENGKAGARKTLGCEFCKKTIRDWYKDH